MRLFVVAVLAITVSACGVAAPSSAPAASATATITAELTTEPSPTPDAGLAAACAALDQIRQTGNLVGTMSRGAVAALDGDMDGWESASLGLVDQTNTVIAALDEVPDQGEFHDFKAQALTLLIGLGDVVIAYDRAITRNNIQDFNKATDQLGDLEATVARLNDEAAAFEDDC